MDTKKTKLSAAPTADWDRAMDMTIQALENARVGQVFRSRKNRVFRVLLDGETLVAKIYPAGSDDRALREYCVLEACIERGVRVPRPVSQSGRFILVEFIEGKTAVEAIDSFPADAESTLSDVTEWLSGFHKAHDMRLCRGDCVLHNFLIASRGVVGVDFEEAHDGNPIEDMGQVIASFLSMRPAFSEGKMEVARRIAAEYLTRTGLEKGDDVPQAVSDALKHYGRFREDGALLNMWAERIAHRGLDSGQK